jgi:hypothetical protein
VRIYCDTDTLFHNIERRKDDPKTKKELDALRGLLVLRGSGEVLMYRSHLVSYEAMKTGNEVQRNHLIDDYNALEAIPNDEKLLGIGATFDRGGGFVNYPIFSDVQNEAIRAELIARGLDQRDAEHITQAICNRCDVFLTRDEGTIINPHREWVEKRFAELKIRRPSELLSEIEARAGQCEGI